ncbi:MAG: response regulator [Paracoccaceae bacterium]
MKNAILHSGCQRITLSYAEDGAEDHRFGLWQIADDGQGVPAALRGDLFSPFRRGEGPRSTQVDGSGLGLYVTKSSIELLGGTVGHQPGPRGGSVFLLRLPMLPAEPAPVPGQGGEPAARPARDWRSHRVLLVEDSDLIGELLVARLKRVFGAVDWARTGIEALARYEVQPPDIVLTDLFMPEMGGDDLTAALRAKGADCPIIGMTAAAIGDERTRFEEAGTDRVLTKPVSTGQFLDVLDELDRQRNRPAAE